MSAGSVAEEGGRQGGMTATVVLSVLFAAPVTSSSSVSA